MSIDNKYAPLIHDNASMLLRPKTGLNDMVVEVDPGTQSAPEIKENSTRPAGLDPAAGEPGRDPRLARRRHPAVPEAAAGERRGGPRSGAGPRREALQRAAPSGPVRARHLEDQRRARDPAPEHRQLDPQLPAPLDRARQPRSGPRQLRGLLERGAGLLRQGAGLDPQRRRRSCPARSSRPRAP